MNSLHFGIHVTGRFWNQPIGDNSPADQGNPTLRIGERAIYARRTAFGPSEVLTLDLRSHREAETPQYLYLNKSHSGLRGT